MSSLIDSLKPRLSQPVTKNHLEDEATLVSSLKKELSSKKTLYNDISVFEIILEFCLERQHSWREIIFQGANDTHSNQLKREIDTDFECILNKLSSVPLSRALFQSVLSISIRTKRHTVRNNLHMV